MPGTKQQFHLRRDVQVALAVVLLIAVGWWYWDEPIDSDLVDAVEAAAMPSIAVLPFANMSADPDNVYFSDGISAEILNALTALSGIKVIARSSSFRFREDRDVREIGELLDVTHVLEGSVRKAGGRVRITAQLIDTTDGSHLWSESYSRDLQDVFAIQEELAGSILEKLEVTLIRAQVTPMGPVDPVAYDAYLFARHQFSLGQYDHAIESYQRAIETAPDFADAYAGLARVHTRLLFFDLRPPKPELEAADRHISKAMALDPDQPEALSLYATKLFFADRDYQAALDTFYDLLKRFPNNDSVLTFARLPLVAIGRYELGLHLAERLVKLDPLSPLAYEALAEQLLFLGRFADADAALSRVRILGKRLPSWGVFLPMHQGDFAKAERYLEMVVGDSPDAWVDHHWASLCLAYVKGETDRAKIHAQTLLGRGGTFIPGSGAKSAALYVLGDESWVAALRQPLSDRSYGTLMYLPVPPALSGFWYFGNWREPEYQELLISVGLDDESVEKLHVQDLPF